MLTNRRRFVQNPAFILISDLEASPAIRACSSAQQERVLELLRTCQRLHGGQSSFSTCIRRRLASKNAVGRGAPAKCRRVPTTLLAFEDMRVPEYVPSHTRAYQVVPHSDRIQQCSSTRCDLLLHQPRNTLTDLGASTRFFCPSVVNP